MMLLQHVSVVFFVGCLLLGASRVSSVAWATLRLVNSTVTLGDPAVLVCCSNSNESEYRLKFSSLNADRIETTKLLCDTFYPHECGRYTFFREVTLSPRCGMFIIRQTTESDNGTYLCHVNGSTAYANLHVLENMTSINKSILKTSQPPITTMSSSIEIQIISTASSLQSFPTVISTMKAVLSSESPHNTGLIIALAIVSFVAFGLFVCLCLIFGGRMKKRCTTTKDSFSINGNYVSFKRKPVTKEGVSTPDGQESLLLKQKNAITIPSAATSARKNQSIDQDANIQTIIRSYQTPESRSDIFATSSSNISPSATTAVEVYVNGARNNSESFQAQEPLSRPGITVPLSSIMTSEASTKKNGHGRDQERLVLNKPVIGQTTAKIRVGSQTYPLETITLIDVEWLCGKAEEQIKSDRDKTDEDIAARHDKELSKKKRNNENENYRFECIKKEILSRMSGGITVEPERYSNRHESYAVQIDPRTDFTDYKTARDDQNQDSVLDSDDHEQAEGNAKRCEHMNPNNLSQFENINA